MSTHYYFSLQYSAIQKTVLRHDRLWSIAGISNILARMNEIELPEIAEQHGGKAIVAGGGKFTGRFPDEALAESARKKCEQHLATTLPMLEFQISEKPYCGPSFKNIERGTSDRNPAISELNEKKRRFRGYAVTFNPHLKLCEECGEYPAQATLDRSSKGIQKRYDICRICSAAFSESQSLTQKSESGDTLTTLERVYREYFAKIKDKTGGQIKPAADFSDLFPETHDERKRMAVWFSDLNNMNDKVPIWLDQEEENNVLETFNRFRDTVVEIIVDALEATFPSPDGTYLPFRLVVAGGDDLCLVVAEQYILDFTRNISSSLQAAQQALDESHPLSDAWLQKHSRDKEKKIKPFGFGSSFIVTSIHTPFSQIHHQGEELMALAKRSTDRQGNSVNWRIMAEQNSVTDTILQFERPLFIETEDRAGYDQDHLSFNEYMQLRKKYKTNHSTRGLSTSHLQQIVAVMQNEKNPHVIDRKLKLLDASEADKSFSPLLRDKNFRNSEGTLRPERLSTLFELMTISGGN